MSSSSILLDYEHHITWSAILAILQHWAYWLIYCWIYWKEYSIDELSQRRIKCSQMSRPMVTQLITISTMTLCWQTWHTLSVANNSKRLVNFVFRFAAENGSHKMLWHIKWSSSFRSVRAVGRLSTGRIFQSGIVSLQAGMISFQQGIVSFQPGIVSLQAVILENSENSATQSSQPSYLHELYVKLRASPLFELVH